MLYCLVALIVCATKMCDSKLSPISPEQVNRRLHLKECVVEVSNRFFTSNESNYETITYCLPMMESPESKLSPVALDRYLLPDLTQSNRINFIIKNLSKPYHNLEGIRKTHVYIIQFRKQEEVLKNLQKLSTSYSWNPRAKFLVISPTVFEQPHKVAQEASKSLWEMNVASAVVMLPRNATYYMVYTWRPYQKGNCGKNFTNTYVIDTCSFGIIQRNVSWFRRELPRQFNKCVIKVNHSNWPPYAFKASNSSAKSNSSNSGIEVNMVNMVADILNLTVAYEAGEIGKILENQTLSGDFKLLFNETIDLVIGGYAKNFENSLFFDVSPSYIQESMIWCVPHLPIMRKLENVISVETWMLILLTYFAMSFLIWYSSCHIEIESTSYKSFAGCLLNLFAVMIGSTSKHLPKTIKVRFLMGLFILYSYNLDSMYTSYMTSKLSTPVYQEVYNSVEDVYSGNLNTYFRPEDIRYFKSRGNFESSKKLFLEQIQKRWINCSDVQMCLEHVAFGKDSSFLLPKLHMDYVLNNASLGKVNCLKEVMVVFPINMIMRKGFPLTQRFNGILNRIISSGFIAKWENEVLNNRYKKSAIEFITFDTVSIKFKYLKSIFELLLMSYSFCLVVFVAEVTYYRMQHRNVKK